MHHALRLNLVGAAALVLVACATAPTETVNIVTQAKGSDYFSIGAPAISKRSAHPGQTLAGRVCRLARSTLLSPPQIRVDHLNGSGGLIEAAHAYVPEIYLARDQTCSDYTAKVAWEISPGDSVRACFDRGKACPAQAESKAVVKAPATP